MSVVRRHCQNIFFGRRAREKKEEVEKKCVYCLLCFGLFVCLLVTHSFHIPCSDTDSSIVQHTFDVYTLSFSQSFSRSHSHSCTGCSILNENLLCVFIFRLNRNKYIQSNIAWKICRKSLQHTSLQCRLRLSIQEKLFGSFVRTVHNAH